MNQILFTAVYRKAFVIFKKKYIYMQNKVNW